MLRDMPEPETTAVPLTLEEARRRLRELQASWEYAFAMGHTCSIGRDPRFDAVHRQVADLSAIIAEYVAADPRS